VPSGIFKPAFLLRLSSPRDSPRSRAATSSSPTSPISFSPSVFIEEKSIEIHKLGQRSSIPPDQSADWIVNVTLFVRSAIPEPNPSITISIPELRISSDAIGVDRISGEISNVTRLTAAFRVKNGVPELWYPWNLGNPKRYNITVALNTPSTPASSVKFTTTTGFRTIVLIQSPYSSHDVATKGITPGDQFHFESNGKAFYSLGTNIIPFDPFYSRMTTEQVRWVIESAVKSGQNMVCCVIISSS
jgi:beta-mannosidase